MPSTEIPLYVSDWSLISCSRFFPNAKSLHNLPLVAPNLSDTKPTDLLCCLLPSNFLTPSNLMISAYAKLNSHESSSENLAISSHRYRTNFFVGGVTLLTEI